MNKVQNNIFNSNYNRNNASIIIAILLSLYIPVIGNISFFINHLFLLFWIFILILNLKKVSFMFIVSCILISILITISISSAAFIGMGERFIQDNIKVFIIIIGVIIISNKFNTEKLLKIIKIFFVLFHITIVLYILIFMHNKDLFTYSGRLFIPYFGSANALSAIYGLSLLFSIFTPNSSKHINIIIISLSVFFLLIGFTRTTFLGLFFGLLFTKKGRYYLIIFLIITIVIFLLFSSLIEIPEWVFIKIGLEETNSNMSALHDVRYLLWDSAILDTTKNIWTILFGTGVGKEIHVFINNQNASWFHPHNAYVFSFWGYGLIGLIMFLTTCLIAIKKIFITKKFRDIKMVLTIFYLISFFFDIYPLGGHHLVIHILVISFIFSTSSSERKHIRKIHV